MGLTLTTSADRLAPAEEKKPSAIFTIDRLYKWRKKDDITEEKEKARKLSAEDVGKEDRVNTGKLLGALFAKTAGDKNDTELRSRLLGALKMPTEDDDIALLVFARASLQAHDGFMQLGGFAGESGEVACQEHLIGRRHDGIGAARDGTDADARRKLNVAECLPAVLASFRNIDLLDLDVAAGNFLDHG